MELRRWVGSLITNFLGDLLRWLKLLLGMGLRPIARANPAIAPWCTRG
jgi:hypothetical protein